MRRHLRFSAVVMSGAVFFAGCATTAESRGYDDRTFYDNRPEVYRTTDTYSYRDPAVPQPTYVQPVPQPTYPAPGYSQPGYVQPGYRPAPTAVVVRSIPAAIADVRGSLDYLRDLVRQRDRDDFVVLRSHLQNMDGQLRQVEIRVANNEGRRRIRDAFEDVQHETRSTEDYFERVGGEVQMRDAWMRVRESVRSAASVIENSPY